jgi:hypothetical protein
MAGNTTQPHLKMVAKSLENEKLAKNITIWDPLCFIYIGAGGGIRTHISLNIGIHEVAWNIARLTAK